MSEAAAAQADLIAAFERGEVLGAPAVLQRIDTHISHVFLTADRAFKLKRAVTLPFADFSSVDKRRDACKAELIVNGPMGAALYLNVMPVVRHGARFVLGGDGEAVDWIVAMRRFDQADQFDVLAAEGRLSLDDVERTAEIVARAHATAPPAPLMGHAADYRHVIHELRETEKQGAKKSGCEAGSPLLFERLDHELARRDSLVEERRRQGKARRGHGDLHLRNICLFESAPLPFDALEFDARLATTDVLYDLAFLLMDLRRVGLRDHANAAMNAYWDAAGEDEAALSLLPFFMSLRAAVRLAVAVEAGDLVEAETYRELGLELLAAPPTRLVAIGGLSGAGKSAVAKAAAPLLPGPAGARLLRTDVLRKRREGLPLDEKAGANVYTPERRSEVYDVLAAHAEAALRAGASVVADGTFQEEGARSAIAEVAQDASFAAYWLVAPLSLRLDRIHRRNGDPSDADAKVAASQQEPADLRPAWRRLDARRPLADNVAAILSDLGQG